MNITKSIEGKKLVFHIEGRADTASAVEFEKTVMDALKQGDTDVVMDLSELEYIASSGLRILLIAAKELKATDRSFSLCGINENIHKILEISGFLSIFKIHPTLEEALGDAG